MSQCILLNQDYSFLNLVNWKRALCLVAKEKVQVLAYSERTVTTAEGAIFKIPSVVKLIKLIRTLYKARVPFSKRNILIRDGFQCAYCGFHRGRLTIDHVIPRSRGGPDDFDNCVACCRACNNYKGGRTPREAGMTLRLRAYQPTISEFLMLRARKMGINELLREFGIF
jgi:5-methylcytosine-specific restriction endonuclease McrA